MHRRIHKAYVFRDMIFFFLLGYVQGMSDLLSPLLYVMENEVDAFWCFASYMDQMVRTGFPPLKANLNF